MKLTLWVTAVVGSLCLGWVNSANCTSFELPHPTEVTGNGLLSKARTRVLWGESYCKELTLKELNGKIPKLCVRNGNPVNQTPTGCLRLSLRNVDIALVKELKVGIHPDCGSIPANRKEMFQRRRSKAKGNAKFNSIRLCFDEIPATETCCERLQCLLFEAVVEVAGVDTTVTVEDGSCRSEVGCLYTIGCPNLINESSSSATLEPVFFGTDSNDLFIIPDAPSGAVNDVQPFGGYDVVIGTDGQETINSYDYGSGGTTAFLKGGEDGVRPGNEPSKIYFGDGNDILYIYGPNGYQDLFYGGGGTNGITGAGSDEDVFKNFDSSAIPF